MAKFSTRSHSPRQPIVKRLPPAITYPEALPVSSRRLEIAQAVAQHAVVIVCGETGSGKTTQLPKICLDMGRGLQRMIGHTQPRRLAATSVAKRIAQELNTPLGEVVGYQIRFNDRTESSTSIKLMTDGILLAESQRDPLLKRYDTLIIDEAHERSLNIDFLLGYLKQLLPRRSDLKLIITSATIDAERFARHFAGPNGDLAPVIEVSGRLYPVEIRWRAVHENLSQKSLNEQKPGVSSLTSFSNSQIDTRDEERDLIDAIVDAVDECAQHAPGDILVFLPGEREIRQAVEALRKHHPHSTEVLPLYAQLSQAEQEKIFSPSGQLRRIVLATNVAETSLTVPGIKYVIDSGLARVKRYSWRQKVEQLRIESISQASANQRAGRCGRTGPGVCIRLYDEADFAARQAFTEPELLRSSLSAVILRMKALRLHNIEHFPFIDVPSSRAIADGYHVLQELGALSAESAIKVVETPSVTTSNQTQYHHLVLTSLGKELARLPVDPRIGRMILAAREQHCLAEMLIIAAALSIPDPRDRPLLAREMAQTAHAKFNDEKSEFICFLKMWGWYTEQVKHKSSQRKLVALLRKNFLSPVRLREWHDMHTQLAMLVGEQGWRVNTTPATYEQLHTALLTGLLGNIGYKSEEAKYYLGVRNLQFYLYPGSALAKKAGRWIIAAEVIETNRLYARCIAQIEPVWIERIASHLLRKNWSNPRWESKSGQVVASERATLYGLTIYTGRRVAYGRINAAHAREIFIRQALVSSDIHTSLAFVIHQRQLIEEIEKLEHQTRRPDILVDDELIFAFYDQLLPADISQTQALEKWVAGLSSEQVASLLLKREVLMRHDAAGITTEIFPKQVQWQGVVMNIDYHFEPGSQRDGVTLSVPLFALNQIDSLRCEWLVPGMIKEKVHLLLKTLPQKFRQHCVPLPDYAAGFYTRWFESLTDPDQSLLEAIVMDMAQQLKVKPVLTDFKLENLPSHLLMNFHIIDEHQCVIAAGRNLAQLKAEHGRQAQANFKEIVNTTSNTVSDVGHKNLTSWTFGPLLELKEIKKQDQSIIGYSALVDYGSHVNLEVFDHLEVAQKKHAVGLLRLFRLNLSASIKFLEKKGLNLGNTGLLFMNLGTPTELRQQIIDCALEQACLTLPWPIDADTFNFRCEEGKSRLGLIAQEIVRLVDNILVEWGAVQRKLLSIKAYPVSLTDLQNQLASLMTPDFIQRTPYTQLVHFPRYLKAIAARVDKIRKDFSRDLKLMSEMAPLLTQYHRVRKARKGTIDTKLDEYYWLLEELRVALFAQECRTLMPVSVKRLQKILEVIQN